MDLPGRRLPHDGRTGIYMSLWMNVEDLDALDTLADRWGTTRSATMKRALHEMQTRVQRRLKSVDGRLQ